MERIFIGCIGIAIGSFLNVLIDRMPRGEDFVYKPSHCDFCKKPLRWFELIPLLSFFLQFGRCRRCHKKLSWQYPAIELLTGMGFVGMYLLGHSSLFDLILRCLIYAAGVVIFMIDLKHQIIPDSMLVLMGIATVLFGIPLSGAERISHLITSLSCGAFFLTLWLITKGRGIGFGDVKLYLVLGLLLGFPGSIIACYVALLTGAFWGVILMIRHKAKLKTRIAFGPFLLFGILIAYTLGGAIWAWWLQML